jgi:DNA-binding transcriptional MerR regulator
MLKIGEFSKLSRISIRMLRHYDEMGLLVPGNVDEFTGYRYYSESQLPLANRINCLKNMGFSLALISEILKTYDNSNALHQFLMLKKAEMKEQSDKIGRQLLLLDSALNRIRKGENAITYAVTLKEMPQRYVAGLRKIVPSHDHSGVLWAQLTKELEPQNVQYVYPCNAISVFHDDEYKENNIDIEIQISVEGSYQDTKNVVFKKVPTILMASTTFKGSYDQIAEVNQVVADWIKDNNYELDNGMIMIYHVTPETDKNPENWITEVCYPVKKK